jgi:hypothetical protein
MPNPTPSPKDIAPTPQEQTFRYGGPTQPETLKAFVDLVTHDPNSVGTVLSFIDQTDLQLAGRLNAKDQPPEQELTEAISTPRPGRPEPDADVIARRVEALNVVWALLGSKADQDLDYPRPVETRISRSRRVEELQRIHRAAGSTTQKGVTLNPRGEAEASLRIRAVRLAIALGSLSRQPKKIPKQDT